MFPKPGLFPKESLEMRQELNFIQMFNSLYNNIFEINLMLLLYGMLGKLVTFICSSHFFLQSLKFLSRGVELVPGPGMMQSFWILAKKFLCSRLLISVMQCTHYNVVHSGQIIRTIYGSISAWPIVETGWPDMTVLWDHSITRWHHNLYAPLNIEKPVSPTNRDTVVG